ncbi:cubilin homolog [Eupeodes corollae]|uniref:cubilin homolog n=1 Tax=Eupeodes corollae TaxID=290404 RepID=UPI002491685F|nr:cubilin homolog [Eupeodes corollae]
MSKTLRTVFRIFIIFLSVRLKNVYCDQPKLISHEGDLIFQSAQDKNITIRLSGSSSFLINDINVLDSLQKFSEQKPPPVAINLEQLSSQVQVLKTDIQRFTFRLRRYENRSSLLPVDRVRRLQTRVLTLMTRVNGIMSKILSSDGCDLNPCKNGGTCYNLYEDFNCVCPKTWTGKTCETDVDECASFAGTDLGCQNNGVCINLPGSYRCNCTNGFLGAHCRDRETDCSKSLPGELCGKGQCIPANNALGYQCLCDSGWKIDNLTQSCTVDVNECLESLVSCHTSCINLPGAFACGPCPPGYTGDGVICRDINECETNNGGCSMLPKVQCINTEGSHRCGNCPPGWTGDGRYCSQTETYSCESTNFCHQLARCDYISNVMVCVCPEGLTGSGYGRNGCRLGSANPCNEHNCQNGGTCVNHGGIATCICPSGFEPPTCEQRNPCLTNPCQNGGTCLRRLNSNETRCNCPQGFSGNRCQIKRETCGSVLNDTSGELTHPYASAVYGPNQGCAWVIRTRPDLIVNVTFSRFDLQNDSTCSGDWLQINDGRSLATPVIGRFCGNDLPKGGNIVSSHNVLFLWFHTDDSINATGFSLRWKSETPICGGLLNVKEQDHGVIKSPGYPGKSPPNRECQWEIAAPLGKRVLLRFFEVVMDNSANCTRDALLIYDTNELLEKICQTGVPPPKYSSTNSVKVHFQTDRSRQDSMFQIHYEVVDGAPGCGGLLTEPAGKIVFTMDLLYCVFLIQQPVGTRISIAFFRKSEEEIATFKIYDGKNEDDPVLTMATNSPGNFTSSGNSLLIVVKMRMLDFLVFNVKSIVFEADFKQVCGQELRDPSGGAFMTPNYPKPYHNVLDCMYSFVGPVNTVVHLNITDYDVSEYAQGCSDDSDYIEIYYALNAPPERHCKGEPMHIIAPSNYLSIAFHSNTNPQRRRGLSGEYYFERIGCGGVLRETEGSFERLGGTSPTNEYCEWILEAPESNVISLDLTYQRAGTKCAPGEVDLRIFLNRTGHYNGRLVESHCGDEKRIVTILPTNLATIFLKQVPPSIGRAVTFGISANYSYTSRSSNCGGNYSLLSGSIQSPGWPDEYYESSDCIWVISAPLGNKIELIPRNFSLEASFRDCSDDYLEIRNGMSEQSPLIGRFCGYDIPPHIPSFTNHLYLHFHSDSSFNYQGFDITFQQTSTGCGGSLTSHTGSIASPHYPEISRGPVQCDWKISVSKGSSVDARITKIGSTQSLCSNNVLTIYDGPDSMAKQIPINCSSDGDIQVKSSQNVMYIRYVLPDVGAAEDQQFYLQYKTNCQQTLNSFEGVIESPNFPKPYPNDLECEWTIEGRKADTISLTFSHFELESRDLQCNYDKFEVIDMKGEEVLQNHKICRDPAGLLTSDGNKFVVKFMTDSNNNGNGFRLEYKRNGCGGYKTGSTASIDSPNYPYAVDIDCEWFIEAPPGMQIVLDVGDVHIEGGSGDCATNGLIVKNDKADKVNLLRACGIQSTHSTVTSQGSKMYVRFYSDSIRSRKYFKAYYRRRQGQCGGTIRNSEGEIASPNYPENYPINTYCEWMLMLGSDPVTVKLFLETTEPQNLANCTDTGLLKVYDGLKSDANSQLQGQYCSLSLGSMANKFIYVKNNILNIIFESDDKPPGKGFLLKYRKSACGGVLKREAGFFGAKPEDRNCYWMIDSNPTYPQTDVSPGGTVLTLSFTKVECHCDGLSPEACLNRGLTINYGGKNNIHICEEHPPDINIRPTTDSVTINATDITFTAKYFRMETACGGILNSLRGSLASPLYPESYPSNVECIWMLNAPSGNYLELSFIEMNITSSDNCNEDYLELRESSATGRLLGVFCSSALTSDSLQGFERIWIKFRSSEGNTGKGFRLSWTNAQLNEITGFNGQIRSPSIVSIKSEKEPFQWRITVPRDSVISLAFKEYNRGLKLFDGFDSTALPIDIQLSPWEVTSSTNVIYLKSDNQMLDQFIIEWKAISRDAITKNETMQACNETMVLAYGSLITLTSPGYPTGYETNLECEWLIKADHQTRHAVVDLYEVRLEKLDECYADHLRVLSSNNLMNWHEELKICDSPPRKHMPFSVIHGTPYLKLELTTDSSINKTGFTANVYTACGSNLTNSIGRILNTDVISPGNEKVTNNCTWHIEVGAGRKIQFTFNFPRATGRNSTGECENYALIRDGMNAEAPILPPGRICSDKDINGTIITTSNRATLKYFLKPSSSFYEYETPLWNLTYREYSECSGEVRLTSYAPSESISSPNYPNVPNPHTECVWVIIAPPGETVQVEFVRNFDMNVRQCSKEFVEFRDGATEMARHLGKYCTRPGTIRSSGNVLYMRYLTDITEPRNGFKANVSLSTCGGTFTQFNNLITSANYPAPGGYPANSVCEYVIKVSTFSRVNLTFLDVDLPFDAANLNSSDQIRIYQIVQGDSERIEDELAVIYGNTTSPPAVQIDTNEVLIRFYSFKANSKFRGFRAKYDRIFGACFKDVSGESGTLTLSIAPRRMAMFLLCRWKITVPKGRRVKLDIIDVDGAGTVFDPVKNFRTTFYNDFQMFSRITVLDLNNITKATSIRSTDNKMFVRIFGAYTTSLRRMRVRYSSSEESLCPDDIENDSGALSVAGLDPAENFFCSFDFKLTGAQTMSFNISSLVVDDLNRRLPSFAVRFKDERYFETLRILNFNMTNELFAVAPKHGSVNILQNDGVRIKKLDATYKKHPCGGQYTTIGQRFEISLPNLTERYGSLDCAWQLLTTSYQNGHDVTANFSFTLPCEDEFVSIHAGVSIEHLEIAKLCRGQTFNMTRMNSKEMYVYYHTKSFNPNSQLQIVFQRATNCGGKLSLELSSSTNLRFTSIDYKNNLECAWDVQASEGYYLQIQFIGRFFIEESKNCSKDYLEVRKFENNDWISMPKYCGRNLPNAFNTTASRLQLTFRSDAAITGDGFYLTIKKTCYAEFNVTNEPQVIKYPLRWSMIKNQMTCDYILRTSDPDKHIQVHFKKLALGYRERCSLTQITAQKRSSDGSIVDMGPYCKDNAVSELRAKNYISLNYQAILETGGYEIEFFLDNCGGEVRKPMWISSLKNEEGDGYDHNMNCIWNISAPVGQNIVIQFKYLIMEESSDCSLDYVSIYKGSQIDSDNQEANLCGNLTLNPPTFHIDSNSAILAAVSDSSISRDGFSARIMFSKACDERITLTNANSPVDIDRNLTVGSDEVMGCNIRAMGPPGFRIEVEIKELNLIRQNRTCIGACEDCEYIEVVDSLEADSLPLGKFACLENTKPKLISSYKDVVVRTNFQRPGIHQFKVNLRLVKAECGGQSEYDFDDDGMLEIAPLRSPNGFYHPNTHCTWKITSRGNFELRFSNFSLQNKSDVTGQCLDYVLVRNSETYSRNAMSEHCGTIPSYLLRIERSGWGDAIAEITFHSDEAVESTGFVLSVSKTKMCNRTYTQSAGVLSGPFLTRSACLNEILVPENYSVNIYISSFFFSGSNCSENYVRVYDKKTNLLIYEDCKENYAGRTIYTSANQVRLDFKADSSIEREVFYYSSPNASLQGCGGSLEMQSGYLMSPNYKEYKNSSVCRWNLTTTSPNRLELFFHEFNMGSICKVDYVDIIEIEANGTERVARHYCEQDSIQSYTSESNRLSIVSVAAGDFDGTGWLIYFRTRSESLKKRKNIE